MTSNYSLAALSEPSLPDGRTGALQIAESLRAQETFKRTVLHTALASMLLLAVVLAALSAVVGTVFVGRPTRALVRKAHRIGEGHLGEPLVMKRTARST